MQKLDNKQRNKACSYYANESQRRSWEVNAALNSVHAGNWGVSAGVEEGQRQQQEGSLEDSFSISADIALAAATSHFSAEIGSCCLETLVSLSRAEVPGTWG